MMNDKEIAEMLKNDDMETQRKKCLWYCDIVNDFKTSDNEGFKRVTIFKLNDYTFYVIVMINGYVTETFKV